MQPHVHLVGIGGAGMSALARLYLSGANVVSGSDATGSTTLDDLRALGATVHVGHDASHVRECLDAAARGARALVVASSAIPATNPELAAARAAGVATIKHAEALATFVNARRGIAVAGTHGKTTTTAMITIALRAGGIDPSFQVGGELVDLDTSAGIGAGDWMVVEADEFDKRFLALTPEVAVLTNVEPEHFECYESDEAMEAAFADFLARTRPGGVVVASRGAGPDDGARLDRIVSGAAFEAMGVTVVRYGMATDGGAPTGDWTISGYRPVGSGCAFTVTPPGRAPLPVTLSVPGAHNAMNATAACAVAAAVGIGPEVSFGALATFRGVRRRFQVIHDGGGTKVIEDYAHHPTEVRATLGAARALVDFEGGGRLWAVFQPHLHVRTERLFDDFVEALAIADRVVVADVYSPPGREPEGTYRGASDLVAAIASQHARLDACHAPIGAAVIEAVLGRVSPGDVVVVMGAGPIDRVGREIAAALDAQGQ